MDEEEEGEGMVGFGVDAGGRRRREELERQAGVGGRGGGVDEREGRLSRDLEVGFRDDSEDDEEEEEPGRGRAEGAGR